MSNPTQKKSWAVGALILSLMLAIGVHTYLAFHYYDIEMGEMNSKSVCNINETFNCDAVSASEYSSLFGIPIALWGATTNGILLCLFLFAFLGFSEERERVLRYSFWFATFIAGMSVVMGTISAFLLSTLCLFCIITYGLSVISWISLWVLLEESSLSKLSEDVQRLFVTHRAVLISVALIPALTFLFHFSIRENHSGLDIDKYLEGFIADWKSSELQEFPVDASLYSKATDGAAKMSIVEFADFRCGHCKSAVAGLHAFMANHKGTVEMKFYSFPLDGICNEIIGRKGDGITCHLAKAVYCAARTDTDEAGWKLHDVIFDHQSDFNSMGSVASAAEKVKELSASLIGSYEKLEECIASNETHEAILAQGKLGEKVGVEGTPTIFINGRKIQLGDRVKVLKRVYRELR
ncbi:MAG: thioredoxin domain-containing protein [Bdellovibrionales bacterium]|nr:thioredoxin domain-containing protein [Bdellovibrionales bacterium]